MTGSDMYHYTSCGLDNVWLKNGFNVKDTPYGQAVSVHDIENLHRLIGLCLVNNEGIISGQMVRFLRKELDVSQSQLATMLGVSENSVRGWENDRTPISGPADRMLRLIYREHVSGDGTIRDLIDRVGKINRGMHQDRIEMEETASGWKSAA